MQKKLKVSEEVSQVALGTNDTREEVRQTLKEVVCYLRNDDPLKNEVCVDVMDAYELVNVTHIKSEKESILDHNQ